MTNSNQLIQRFNHAGNTYVIAGDELYQELNETNDNLNGLGFRKKLKKIGKKLGKLAKKVLKSPLVGIVLTVASGGAFGVLSAGQLMAVNAAQGMGGLLKARELLKQQGKADKANAAYYNDQVRLVDNQILAKGGRVPNDGTLNTSPNNFVMTPDLMLAAGAGLLGVILILTSSNKG